MEINEATQPCAWLCVAGEIFLAVITVFFLLFSFTLPKVYEEFRLRNCL